MIGARDWWYIGHSAVPLHHGTAHGASGPAIRKAPCGFAPPADPEPEKLDRWTNVRER